MTTPSAFAAIADIWTAAHLSPDALADLILTGSDPIAPSSFAVGTAAQASLACAALAASEIRHARNGARQSVGVDMRAAAAECTVVFTIDGRAPDIWDKLSGLYPCGGDTDEPGFVRIHANFAHHRDRALAVLGLPAGDAASREDVTRALRSWSAVTYEDAAMANGAVVAALRSFAAWDALSHAKRLAAQPLVSITRIGDASPRAWRPISADAQPLDGLRVLDLTRILAGPLAGRTLAAYGADVLLINSPELPNIDAIMDLSRGKLSAHVDLETEAGRDTMRRLIQGADVFVQGYRPGALAARGFGAQEIAGLSPGIVAVSLSAYGQDGPWAQRRGFDSLVQTATGFNDAEGRAFVPDGTKPRALPMQILDCAAGFLMAFGAQAALLRQRAEGGTWHVEVSLARTGLWLRSLGRVEGGTSAPPLVVDDLLQNYPSGYGALVALPHAAAFDRTPARWMRPSMPPGSHPAAWPDR